MKVLDVIGASVFAVDGAFVYNKGGNGDHRTTASALGEGLRNGQPAFVHFGLGFRSWG